MISQFNQLDENGEVNQQGYYHFIGQPGEQKAVSIQVFNASEKEIRVNATVNPASTNQNGVPSYQGEATVDSSLVHRMDELVAIEEDTLTVPAGGSATMNLTVSMPNEEWEGDVLGGIRFTQESTQESEQTVVHEVAYTVGILLNQEQGVVVENELTLNEVGAGQRNYRNYIEANLQNRAAAIVQEARLDHVWSGGTEVGRVPFVATEDRRGTDRLGWELQVSQPNQLSDASGHELEGATITLSGLRYANPTTAAPTVNPNELILGDAAQTLAIADATQGAGAWTLALGNADGEGQTDGVVLRIPANTTKNDTTYSTAIVWELVADPTTGGE